MVGEMENLKIKVNSEQESKEAQDLFFKLGYEKGLASIGHYPATIVAMNKSVFGGGAYSSRATKLNHPDHECLREIRMQELRAMVNPVQKEYLQKLTDGSYKLVVLDSVVDGHDGLIEVPEGADILTQDGFFWDGIKLDKFFGKHSGAWENATSTMPNDYYLSENPIVWQRGEEVMKSAVDVTLDERQSTYGGFKDVAHTTQYLLQMLSNDNMSDVKLEALHMICSKLARITHGDVNHVDSWHDIAGYATLVVNELENK